MGEDQINTNIYSIQNKKIKKIFLIFLGIGIFCIALGIIIDKRRLPDGITLNNVSKEGEYVKCYIYAISDYFASTEYNNSTTNMYYLASDGQNIYVLDLSKKQYKDIIEKMDDEQIEEEIYINGTTQNMTSDLRKYAKEQYNAILGNEDDDSFSDYIVPYVINAKVNPNNISSTFYLYGILSLFISFMNGIAIITNKRKENRMKNKID